jgi:NNP family nitrate/nitrite transporter-like MFS transporter
MLIFLFFFPECVYLPKTGIVSGLCGASGNLGGILFTIIYRYIDSTSIPTNSDGMGSDGGGSAVVQPDYARIFNALGVFTASVNVLVLAFPPVPKRQIGGR